jgi:hypothetical protein
MQLSSQAVQVIENGILQMLKLLRSSASTSRYICCHLVAPMPACTCNQHSPCSGSQPPTLLSKESAT